MRVSYCITCKGRLHHLQRSLPANLLAEAEGLRQGDVEFALIDYDSRDGLDEWVRAEYASLLDSGQLQFGQSGDRPQFDMAHAKNLAHRLATGDILVNLDADNLLPAAGSRWLRAQFRKQPNSIIGPRHLSFHGFLWDRYGARAARRPRPIDGIAGRIAISREGYYRLGGYDESIKGWGSDDIEFMLKARDRGFTPVYLPPTLWGGALKHSDEERLLNTGGVGRNGLNKKPWIVVRDRHRQYRRRDR